MQGFYFFGKFAFVFIYILKVCRKKSSSIFHFAFEKHVPYQVLKDFFVENQETTPRSIYMELLIIGVVFSHYA